MIFWTLPLSALFIILRTHVVRVVLGAGAFDWADTKLTAAVMSLFALSFVFQSAQLFLTRAHYALGKTKVPLILGFSGAILTIILAYLFYFDFLAPVIVWLQKFLEIEGVIGAKIIILPIAFSFGTLLTSLGLWFFLDKETKYIAKEGILKTFVSVLLASIVIGLVTFYSLRIFDDIFKLDTLLNVFGHALLSGLVGILAGVLVMYITKNKELQSMINKFY